MKEENGPAGGQRLGPERTEFKVGMELGVENQGS